MKPTVALLVHVVAALALVMAPSGPAGTAAAAAPPAPATLSAADVVERARQALRDARDLQVEVRAEARDEHDKLVRSVIRTAFLRSPEVVRLEVVEPAAFADQVFIIDFADQQVQVYLPVTNQILVQPLAKAVPAGTDPKRLSPVAMLDALGPVDPQHVRLVGTRSLSGRTYYVLEVTPQQGQIPTGLPGAPGSDASQHLTPGAGPSFGGLPATPLPAAGRIDLWVDTGSFLVTQVEIKDRTGKSLGHVELTGWRLNTGLKAADLRELPADAEIVEG